MDVRRALFFLVFILLATATHAASFDCKKALAPAEKIICGSSDLSELDSKLSQAYQSVYDASGPVARKELLIDQRSWVRYVRVGCEDEECVAVAYQDRIDQLEDLAKDHTHDNQAENLKALDFKGLQLGQVLDDKKAHEAFQNLECDSKNSKQMAKLMESAEHPVVIWCEGKTTFENQDMDAVVELYGNRRLAEITMCYDTPYPLEGVNTTSVSEMEDRLIATYGQPKVLRTESRHQRVKYDPKDLVENGNPLDGGEDEWVFANGASIVLGSCLGHQKEPGGHIFSSESISFSIDRKVAAVTLPAHHAIPIILTKLTMESGNNLLWKPDELMTVMLYVGGKRTCTVGTPIPLVDDDRGSRYMTTMTCTDFVEIGYSPTASALATRIHVVRGSQLLGVGYIPASKAIAGLERP
jgi:uncharacterized protein